MEMMEADDSRNLLVLHQVAGFLLALLFAFHWSLEALGWEALAMDPWWSLLVHLVLVLASLASMARFPGSKALQALLLALPGIHFLTGTTLGVSEQSLAFLFLAIGWSLHLLDGGWKHPGRDLALLVLAGGVGLAVFATWGRPAANWLTFLSTLVMMALASQLASALGKANAARLALLETEGKRMRSLAVLGTSLGTFGHDLRNQTASQRIFLDLLLPRLRDDPESFHLASRIGALISELEASGRTLVGQVLESHDRIERFDLGELCRVMSERICSSHAKQVDVELDAADMVISSSLGPWLAILDNLLRNAAEAGGPGNVGLVAGIRADRVELTVSNDGPPLPFCAGCGNTGFCFPGDCGTFQPGKTGKPGGSGLGMLSVQTALARLEGSLKIKSAPGRTSFHVCVRLACQADRQESPQPVKGRGLEKPGPETGDMGEGNQAPLTSPGDRND